MTNEEKMTAITMHFEQVRFPDGQLLLIRATHRDFGFISEMPNSKNQAIQVCPGYRESFYRIMFAVVHGYLPVQVDHKDGDHQNSSIENLRAATPQQNAQNRKKVARKNGLNLPRGVYARKNLEAGTVRYQAASHYCDEAGVQHWKSLGLYSTPEEAERVFNEYTKERHGEFFRDLGEDVSTDED